MVYFFSVILRFSPFSSSYLRSRLVWCWFQSLLSPEFYDKVRPIKVLKWNEPKTDFYFCSFLKIFDDISKLSSLFSIISLIFMADLFYFFPQKAEFSLSHSRFLLGQLWVIGWNKNVGKIFCSSNLVLLVSES